MESLSWIEEYQWKLSCEIRIKTFASAVNTINENPPTLNASLPMSNNITAIPANKPSLIIEIPVKLFSELKLLNVCCR